MERFEVPAPGDVLYYTDGFISNLQTLSIVTVLYDRVFTYYLDPNYYATEVEEGFEKLKKMGFTLHKKNLLTGEEVEEDTWVKVHKQTASTHLKKSILQFWQDNSLLRDEGVLLPIGMQLTPKDWTNPKEFLESEIGMQFFRSEDWARLNGLVPPGKSYIDVGFFHVHRLVQASTGLHFALTNGMVPFADHPMLASMASALVKSDLSNIAYFEQSAASLLSHQAICHLVPDFGRLKPEEILEIRNKTKDERGLFTHAMERLAYSVPLDADIIDVQYEIKKIVQTELEPALLDLQNNIRAQKKELFRKLCLEFAAGATGIPVLVQQLSATPKSVLLGAMGLVVKGLIDIHNYRAKIDENRNKASFYGLGFILDLENITNKKPIKEASPCGILPQFYND
jgi:hypothetical protein